MAILYPIGHVFRDNSGQPLAGGLVHTYENGTTTNKTAYSDRALTTALANPVVLDAAGKLSTAIYVPDGDLYTVDIQTSAAAAVDSSDDQFGYPEGGLNSLRSNGAAGDGTTDDGTEIESALVAGGNIDGEGLTYRIDSPIAVALNNRVVVKNATFDFSNNTTLNARLFDFSGVLGDSVTPTAITAGDSTATFPSTAGHAKDDWLLFQSSDVWGQGGSIGGEWNQIRSVDSGTVDTFQRKFHLGYTTTPLMYRPTLQPFIKFENCRFIGGGDAYNQYGLVVTLCKEFRLEGCTFENFAQVGSWSEQNVFTWVTDNNFLNGDTTTLSYGLVATKQHESVICANNHGQELNHVIVCGGSTGVTWNVGLFNTTGNGCTEAIVDCHNGTAWVTIEGVTGNYRNTQGSTDGDGVVVQGAYTSVSGVTINGAERHAVLAQPSTMADNDFMDIEVDATDWGSSTSGGSALVAVSLNKTAGDTAWINVRAKGVSGNGGTQGFIFSTASGHVDNPLHSLRVDLDVECDDRCVDFEAGSAAYAIERVHVTGIWETTGGDTEACFISGNANVNFTDFVIDPAIIRGGTHAVENDNATVVDYHYKIAEGQVTGLLDGAIRVYGFPQFTVAGVPAAANNTGLLIYVSDEVGGATMAFSNGTNWLRVQDLATITT